MDNLNSALNELLKVVMVGAIAIATAWVRAWIKKEVEKKHLEALERAAYNAVIAVEKQCRHNATGKDKKKGVWDMLVTLFPSADGMVLANAIEVAHRDAGLEHPMIKEVITPLQPAINKLRRTCENKASDEALAAAVDRGELP